MRIAIYSRKSKFTGKGESIGNQIDMCKDYISSHFGEGHELLLYEDEGFSGGNIDRPQFKLMLQDAKLKKFDTLICYRLDRISRNIADFSSLIEDLSTQGINFVSIREQFDTTTPMGRAMMYIASVFAQLERETIAERIRDNMLQLAKTGRWLGGITPTGYESVEFTVDTENGKLRKAFKLSPIEEEINVVKLIFEKYLELNSLTQLETYLLNRGIVSKNNKPYTRFTLRSILENPVYAIADEEVYTYLQDNEYTIYAEDRDFDGEHGLMAYNKTIQKKKTSNKVRDPKEWILSVGEHTGIIKGKDWVQVQRYISNNKSKSFRKVKNIDALLSGILRCKSCGSFMRPKGNNRFDAEGNKVFYYSCELKERSRLHLCNMKNCKGNDVDYLVLEELKRLSFSGSTLKNKVNQDHLELSTLQDEVGKEVAVLEEKLKVNENSIKNLVGNLTKSQGSAAEGYIIEQINALDKQNAHIKEEIFALKQKHQQMINRSTGLTLTNTLLDTFSTTIDQLETEEKRTLIKTLVDKVTWDGEKVNIVLFPKP